MDDSVFHRLYDYYHRDVFQFLVYLIKDRETAEDLMHEVYIRAFRAFDRFEGKSTEKTWLFSIAKNVSIDHFRKMAVRRKRAVANFDWETEQLVSSERLPEEVSALNEDKIMLYRALDACTGDQKMVIIIRFFQDLSIAETADVLDWTESKVKTTQHRAIKALRERMNALERGEEHGR
ncbi:RNA polymerase sigma factor SigX [Planomicrobium sp. YIM 101495]|uniref:RNA polymerase sigma factor SigX n=1 Tax=Planomicrobium sp. YIM 101495 TaxID=2665160 RepID=UPI0012B83997|nr:RNA polymerase sigma factor SigX [Planomicrobium sp. YIM 101495]MTD30088.1 sigma-70 family RNA polymerase sigma factor [Planomicrobium sp. YIM 101495]